MTLPKGFCECGHLKEFHSDLDNKCTKCQCVKFGWNKKNRLCDCGHQQSNHLEKSSECTQCNCFEFKFTPYETSLDWPAGAVPYDVMTLPKRTNSEAKSGINFGNLIVKAGAIVSAAGCILLFVSLFLGKEVEFITDFGIRIGLGILLVVIGLVVLAIGTKISNYTRLNFPAWGKLLFILIPTFAWGSIAILVYPIENLEPIKHFLIFFGMIVFTTIGMGGSLYADN